MKISRRRFLKLFGGSVTAAAIFQACGIPEKELIVEAPLEMPEDMVSGTDNWYATLSPGESVSSGIVVRVMEGRAKKIEGNPDYPINQGKHNVVAESGLQGLYHPDRISSPRIRRGDRGEGKWEEISWTDALSRISESITNLKKSSGLVLITDPLTSHLSLVINQFVSKFKAKHIQYEVIEDTNLRWAVKNVFKQDRIPDFDIDNSDYVLSFGADFLNTWKSPLRYSRGYSNFREQSIGHGRGTLVYVGSHLSLTGANADKWIYVNPGSEGILAYSISYVLLDKYASELNISDKKDWIKVLSQYSPSKVKEFTGLSESQVEELAHGLAKHKNPLVLGGGTVGAYTNGMQNLEAIYTLNVLLGNLGKKGGVVFNPILPIAMDGFSDLSPDLANSSRIDELKSGDLEILLLRGANPIYGTPGFKSVLSKTPLIVSFSGIMDDSAMMADIILPENHYLEEWGSDIPNPGPGYPTIGFQQPVVRPVFEKRGIHLGTKSFPDVMMALAEIQNIDLELNASNYENVLRNMTDELFKLNRGSIKAKNPRDFWNGVLQRGGWWDVDDKVSNHKIGSINGPRELTPAKFLGDKNIYPFHLVPFELGSLTDGRGANLPWLQATPDPITTVTWSTWVEINLNKAKELGIKEGDIVKITSEYGEIEAFAYPHPAISPDVLAIPIGQGHESGDRYSSDRGSNVLSILATDKDKDSGAWAWASTRVSISSTGNNLPLSKFENTAPDLSVDAHGHIIKTTSGESK